MSSATRATGFLLVGLLLGAGLFFGLANFGLYQSGYSQTANFQKDLLATQESLNSVKTSIAELKDVTNQAQNANLQKDISVTQESLSSTKTSVVQLKADLTNQAQTIANLTKSLQAVNSELIDIKKSIAETKQEIENLKGTGGAAQVRVLNVAIPSGVVAAKGWAYNGTNPSAGTAGLSIYCDNTFSHPATQNGTVAQLRFSNIGVANSKIMVVALTFGGVTYFASFSGTYPQTGCTIASSGTLTMYLTRISVAPGVSATAGGQFVGSITLFDGAKVQFAGVFA